MTERFSGRTTEDNSTLDRAYRLLLSIYPAAFRKRFGDQMVAVFRDQRKQHRNRSAWRLLAFYAHEFNDLAATGTRLRFRDRVKERAFTVGKRSQRNFVERTNLMIESLWNDIRFGLRSFRTQPLFCLIVILTLALGIGANSAIFSVVNSVLLRTLPYEGSERIVMVWEDFSAQGGPPQEWIEVPNLFEWRKQSQAFETLSAFGFGGANLTGGGDPERVGRGSVSHNFFQTFATEPLIGRDFRADDDQPDSAPVVILSHDLWANRFGAKPSVVGQPLFINAEPSTVIGVLPRDFETPFSPNTQIWTPLRLNENSAGRGNFFLQGVARLKEGVPLTRATAEMNTIMERIGNEFPENAGVRIQLVPLLDQIVQPVRTALLVVLCVVVLVLLIGCANIANLVLSRGATREREIAVRAALGAGRVRILRQLLTESTVLSLLGAALGLLLASWGVGALVSLAPLDAPRIGEVGLDGSVVFFTVGLAFLTSLLFGLVPALHAAKADSGASLREGGREFQASIKGARLRTGLVVGEVALALTLLIGSGLMLRSFGHLLESDPGFDPEGLVAAGLTLSSAKYPEREHRTAFMDDLLQRVGERPGIDSVAAVSVLPLSGIDSDTSFRIEGRPEPSKPQETPTAWYRLVTSDYFKTMRIPLLEGRELTRNDHSESPRVVIMSEVAAEKFWPGESAVGKRIRFGGDSDDPWITVVGVVKGIRHNSLDRSPLPEMYLPYAQLPGRNMTLVVRSKSDESAITEILKTDLRGVDSELPLTTIGPVSALVSGSIAQNRFFTSLTTGFAMLALALAAVGIYGVMSFAVTQKTYEMGLRMALGAQRGDVLGIVMKQGLLMTIGGISLGVALALATTGLMSSILFAVSPTDSTTFVGVSVGLAVIALIACLVPALRATRIDPLAALRCE